MRRPAAARDFPQAIRISYIPFKQEPLRSLRFVQMLSGIEDYEILNAIAQKDKTHADSFCKRGMRSFVEYITDVDAFDALEQELVSAYDAL